MTPVAAWLRETRNRHLTPEGRPWSQEYTVNRVNEWAAETGQIGESGRPWQLHRPNYVGYEGTTEPTPWTLNKLVAFWTAQGEPAPDLRPAPDPEPRPSLEERAVIAAERQAEAAERS